MTRSAAPAPTTTHLSIVRPGIRLEQVLTGQQVRLPSRGGKFQRVTERGPGLCHGIRLGFADGSSMTGMPSMLVDVAA